MIRTLAVLTILAAACGGVPKRSEPLEESVRRYHEGVRWERFDRAAARLPATERDEFLAERDELAEELRIHNYEVIRVRLDEKKVQAKVHIKYTWHLDSKGIVEKTHTVQSWERHGKIWLKVDEEHLRGEPMPGVAVSEPAEVSEAADEEWDTESP